MERPDRRLTRPDGKRVHHADGEPRGVQKPNRDRTRHAEPDDFHRGCRVALCPSQESRAKIVEEPHETVYGEFQYATIDLEGHLWLFSRHAHDLSPDAWGSTVVNPH